ncbi:hypothetical protein F7725_019714 [Dissostichus mawsoni]|uniref:WxxW domain-containing protein n=1 Tax=Dissostichus mawsoni TaxID=36200 RepID=A0A7J5YKL9_DISMA|nr:hypothetical protein F7725_019714 [Dissostichus mawsoni]
MNYVFSNISNLKYLKSDSGIFCLMKDQKSGECRDYKVRFGCPTIEGLSPTQAALIQHTKRAAFQTGHCWGQMMFAAPELPSPESHQRVPGPEDPEYPKGPEDPEDPVVKPVCWTDWFDRDNPSGSGDWELSSDLRKENPGKICDYPLYIEVVTTDTMTPAIPQGRTSISSIRLRDLFAARRTRNRASAVTTKFALGARAGGPRSRVA